ncbi:hypothetical protein MUU48_16845 [Scandinavium sp. H11S7]|uniref:Uncharacterized protein n=1 Tax=Scandinavium hiltneri TaxID=2926519 RepID=A0ABT2E5I2_9ENTR|nr:hypothetical protein [Scandinavium hiltneri]MCS2158560.1 hypothetical protein [Scandinavium hiltneri]MCS2163141.1 hypothetical protein [Scandinavium hiltneri]
MIYHSFDTRSDRPIAARVVVNFEFPQINGGKSFSCKEDGVRKIYQGSLDYFLQRSEPGNRFCGIMNIFTGTVDIYPIDAMRDDALDGDWGQKTYDKVTYDKQEPIFHSPATTGGGSRSSHTQLCTKINSLSGGLFGKKMTPNYNDYIGFTFNDIRSLRNNSARRWLSDETSMLYGVSRSLNLKHVKEVAEHAVPQNSNLASWNMHTNMLSKEVEHIPVELRIHILRGIKILPFVDSSWKNAIDAELNRRDMTVAGYKDRKRSLPGNRIFV